MPLVDYERVVQQFEAELLGKRAWGQKDLILLLARLRAENAVDEGQIDRTLRLYTTELEERFFDRHPSATGREPQASTAPRVARDDVPGALDHREAHSAPEEAASWNPPPQRPSPTPTPTSPRTSRRSAEASAVAT